MQELFHVITSLVVGSTLMHSQIEKLLRRPTLRTQNFEAEKDKYANPSVGNLLKFQINIDHVPDPLVLRIGCTAIEVTIR